MSRARAAATGSNTGNPIRDSALGQASALVDQIIALNDSVWRANSVRPALLEMLRLRNARTVNCVFCRSVRYDVARADGLDEATVALIEDGFEHSALDDIGKAVLSFADVYLHHPERFEPALIANLRRHFSEEQICHLAIALATFNATSRCAVALGGMPESLPVMEIALPAPLR